MDFIFNSADQSLLDSLGRNHNTDKASTFRGYKRDFKSPAPSHDYLRKYEFFLSAYRSKRDLKLLEIGAGPDTNLGASAYVWRDYFSEADIHVADIKRSVTSLADHNIMPHVGDIGDPKFLEFLKSNIWDIIIDDASHAWGHQISCFKALFSSLTPGGLYICEDIQTSFGDYRNSYSCGNVLDAYSFFTILAGHVTGEVKNFSHPFWDKSIEVHGITPNHLIDFESLSSTRELARCVDMVTFIKHSCIILKK